MFESRHRFFYIKIFVLKFSVAQIETRKMNEREAGKYPIKDKVHIGEILRRERPIRFSDPKTTKLMELC